MPGLTKFVERYTDEQLSILEPFFTNTDKGIFALKASLPQTTKAAFFARYSRSPMSLRTLFLKEFVTDPETGNYYDGLFDHIKTLNNASKFAVGGPRSDAFFNRVLSEYGDDSVIDSASAHIALEGVDQVEAKAIEDGRLAGYIEKSTRYVDFTTRYRIDSEGFITGKSGDGMYLYRAYPAVLDSKIGNAYTEVNDLLFSRIKEMQPMVANKLREIYPLENFPLRITVDGKQIDVKVSDIPKLNGVDVDAELKKAESAYRTAVKASSLDVVRIMLPMSTMTNLGWFASYRSLDHSLVKMLASAYPPSVDTANMCYDELIKVDGPLIRRVKGAYGADEQKFLRERDGELQKLAMAADSAIGVHDMPKEASAKLVYAPPEHDSRVMAAAAALYPYTNAPYDKLVGLLRRKDAEKSELNSGAIIAAAASHRSNRRHKLPRAFEFVGYTAEFVGDIGIFRDLQRNRFSLQLRQRFGINEGYEIPWLIRQMGMSGKFTDAIEAAESLYRDAVKVVPQYAEACVTFAHRVRWIANVDLRQAGWWLELRTSPQGHPSYRRLMQKLYQEMNTAHPSLASNTTMQFVDMDDYPLGRLAAAHNTENKLERLDDAEKRRQLKR